MRYASGPMGVNAPPEPYQFTPELRVTQLTEAIKFHLQVLESQLSFSAGTLSLVDVRRGGGTVTATQVMADKKDTFEAVTYINDYMVKPGIAAVLQVFSEMADVLGIPNSGSGVWEVSTEMNTQASVDPTVRFNQAVELYQMGLIPGWLPVQYSQLQVTEEEAQDMIAEARASQPKEETEPADPNA
jgi:A118 family predicted phage portal protein